MSFEVRETKAKQGDRSSWTLKILAVSLIAAFAIWGVAEIYYAVFQDPAPSNSAVEQNEPG